VADAIEDDVISEHAVVFEMESSTGIASSTVAALD
jgi:hypothetical protein